MNLFSLVQSWQWGYFESLRIPTGEQCATLYIQKEKGRNIRRRYVRNLPNIRRGDREYIHVCHAMTLPGSCAGWGCYSSLAFSLVSFCLSSSPFAICSVLFASCSAALSVDLRNTSDRVGLVLVDLAFLLSLFLTKQCKLDVNMWLAGLILRLATLYSSLPGHYCKYNFRPPVSDVS